VTAGAAPPRLEIVAGRADDMRAEIALIVTLPDGEVRPTISGTLVGPWRGRETTLPTTVTLAPLAAALPPTAAAARAVFTEPAYWSPGLPNLYRLRLRIEAAGREAVTLDRLVGLRRLGRRGRSLWLEGRRWVPRGVAGTAAGFEPAAFRRRAAAVELVDPTPEVCAAADAAGVAIVARLAEPPAGAVDLPGSRIAAAVERVAAWASHPSVVLVVVPRGRAAAESAAIATAVGRAKGTMLLAVEIDGTRPPSLAIDLPATPASSAGAGAADRAANDAGERGWGRAWDCVVVDLPEGGLPHEAWRSWPGGLPLLARRAVAVADDASGTAADDVAALRLECDRLQAGLAAWGVAAGVAVLPWDWAGYLAVPTAAVSRPSPPA
jgi:hypothetical protein